MHSRNRLIVGMIVIVVAGSGILYLNDKYFKYLQPSCDDLLHVISNPANVKYMETWAEDLYSEMTNPANKKRMKTMTKALLDRNRNGLDRRFKPHEEPMFEERAEYAYGRFKIRKKVDWKRLGLRTDVGWGVFLIGSPEEDDEGLLILNDLPGVAIVKGNSTAFLISFDQANPSRKHFALFELLGDHKHDEKVEVNCPRH